MKLEIDIPDETAARLLRWPIPAEHCGPTLAERVAFLIDQQCLALEGMERTQQRNALYRMLGMRSPDELDDDISL